MKEEDLIRINNLARGRDEQLFKQYDKATMEGSKQESYLFKWIIGNNYALTKDVLKSMNVLT